jgi:hypothetical protein
MFFCCVGAIAPWALIGREEGGWNIPILGTALVWGLFTAIVEEPAGPVSSGGADV